MLLWISIIIATLAVQIPNIWAIKAFAHEPSIKTAFWIGFVCLPASLIANAGFAYFYGLGFQKYSYPVMSISAYGVSLIVAFAIQSFVLKHREVLIADYIAVFFVVTGLFVMIFRDNINKLFI